MSISLHPQNDRWGQRGPEIEGLDYFRFPPVYVTEHGQHKHETPLCPHVRGRVHYAICREDALYIYGERWCETCRRYDVDEIPFSDRSSGWTDPRYRESR